jgi:transposase
MAFGKAVTIQLFSRKFFCDNSVCSRSIFTERFGSLIRASSRRTERLNEALVKFAFSLSSEVVSRISKYIFPQLSADTFIGIIGKERLVIESDYNFIGIDDWAFRKGLTYGTLICDLKTHRPIELLKDRTTKTLADWLKDHKDIELVTRDRANAYSKAVDDALPSAIQIADKWHLLKNMGDTLNSILQSQYTKGITIENTQKHKEETMRDMKPTQQEMQRQTRMSENMELIEETKRLYTSGIKQKEISTLLGISKKTIYRYLRRSEPTYSSTKVRGSILDEYIKEIDELFIEGTSSKDILANIRQIGYEGCESLFRIYLSKLNKLKVSSNNENNITSASKLVKRERLYKLFWRNYDELTEKNQLILNEIIQSSLQLSKIYQSVQSFREIISDKNSSSLVHWIDDNIKSEIIHIKKFAQSLKKDVVAVSNTLKHEYTNAVLEGHVNRLKNIKRMMYGRANFDLLRQRVLFQI